MDITNLKLLPSKHGSGLELTIEKTAAGGDKVSAVESHKALVHPDLFKALQELAPHLAVMAFHAKTIDPDDGPNSEKFKDFSVGSYHIRGENEKRGIVISGTLRKHGKAHNFNTPFYRFSEPDSSEYQYMQDLEKKLEVLDSEVRQYLDGTKRGEAIQGELNMDEKKTVTKIQIDNPAEKVTEEGNSAPESSKHKYANKDAMARVAEMDVDKKKSGKKKVQQTAATPSGEVSE